MVKAITTTLCVLGAMTGLSRATLFIDFDRSDLNDTQPGYQSYSALHEVEATFTTQNFATDFAGTPANVSITPAWPNTTDNRVQQLIDRGAVNDANWDNSLGFLPLVTDWLGTDTRVANGGNGDFDGTTGTPTYLTLTLGGLPAGNYSMTSLHHDTENVNVPFTVEVSVNGGGTFINVANAQMTDSTPLGTPASAQTFDGPDPFALPSTQTYGFAANGTDDVVLRYTPLSNSVVANGGGVHHAIFGINGFTLVPEPAVPLMSLCAMALLAARRRRQA